MKVLIYAIGGGLGHITRAYKLSQFLLTHLGKCKISVIASFQYLPNFLIQNLNILRLQENDIQNISFKIQKIIDEFQPDLWITDVFPNGIFYELPLLLNHQLFYKILINRIVKPEFCRIYSEIEYDESWQIEWLPDYMKNYSQNLARKNIEIRLPILQDSNLVVKEKKWILHTGSFDEINLLKKKHPDFEVIHFMDNYPLPIMENCQIVTAAGCNTLQDLAYLKQNHYVYPLNRKFDNQKLRAENISIVQRWFLNS